MYNILINAPPRCLPLFGSPANTSSMSVLKSKKSKIPLAKLKDITHDSMPASVKLVKEVRDELKADLGALEHRINSKFSAVDSKVELIQSELKEVKSSARATQVLMEEQRSENRIVLDGIKTIIEKQERLERRS
jgi:hypothetical protein